MIGLSDDKYYDRTAKGREEAKLQMERWRGKERDGRERGETATEERERERVNDSQTGRS